MPMSAKTLEKWSWVLIYGGLLLVCLGVFVREQQAVMGWVLVAAGAAMVLAGAIFIALRAKLPESPSQHMPPRKE